MRPVGHCPRVASLNTQRKGNAKDEAPQASAIGARIEAPKAPRGVRCGEGVRKMFSNLDLQMATFGAFWGQVCAFQLQTPESDYLD